MSYIDSGKCEGAELLTGGKRVGDRGYFIEPTVFATVKDEMKIAREEIFGPVMSIIQFHDIDEVVERANNTMYGLAAGVWTGDIGKAYAIANSVRAGTIWVNCFDGFKQSGIDRENGRICIATVHGSKNRHRPTVTGGGSRRLLTPAVHPWCLCIALLSPTDTPSPAQATTSQEPLKNQLFRYCNRLIDYAVRQDGD